MKINILIIIGLLVLIICTIGSRFDPYIPSPSPAPISIVKTLNVFTAEWCSYCQKAKPTIAKLKESGIHVTIIDVDKSFTDYKITALPTFVCRNGNKFLETHDVKELVEFFK